MTTNEIEKLAAKALADSDCPEEKALPLRRENGDGNKDIQAYECDLRRTVKEHANVRQLPVTV